MTPRAIQQLLRYSKLIELDTKKDKIKGNVLEEIIVDDPKSLGLYIVLQGDCKITFEVVKVRGTHGAVKVPISPPGELVKSLL